MLWKHRSIFQKVLDALDWQIDTSAKKEIGIDSLDLSDEERPVFERIATQDCTTDALCAELGIEFGDLTVTLMDLELKGYIRQTDGGKYISEIKI